MIFVVGLPHSNPMPGTVPEYLVKDGLILVFIAQIADQLPSFPLLLDLEALDAAVVPPRHAFLLLQRDNEHVDIVVPAEDVLVRIKDNIRQLVADLVHVIFGVAMVSEDVVDAVQPAEKRDLVLSLEVLSLHCTIFILIPKKYTCVKIYLHKSSMIKVGR